MIKDFWQMTIFLNDESIGYINFFKKSSTDDFLRAFRTLPQTEDKKWGFALIEGSGDFYDMK